MHPEYRLLHLNLPSRYALSAAARLTVDAGEYRMVEEIAAPDGLPPAYLSKVLRKLARAGILDSRRGAKGGYRLSRPANDISVSEIISAARGLDVGPMPCMIEARPCDGTKPCSLHHLVEKTERAMRRGLDETSLADLVRPRSSRLKGK